MLESGRHLHGGEGAHIPFPNPSFGSECPRQFFFVVAAEDVLDQQLLLLKRLQNHLLQLLADLLYVVLVLFAEDVVLSQIPFHSFGVGEASQRTPEQHTVETGHHSLYIFLELGDKPLHGVLFLRYAWWNWILQQRITWIERQHRLRLAAMRGMASALPPSFRAASPATNQRQILWERRLVFASGRRPEGRRQGGSHAPDSIPKM